MLVFPVIAPDEELGRGVFSRRDANRADRDEIPVTVFLERPGIVELSTDRLTLAPQQEAIQIAERRARGRGPNRSFYGWVVITVQQAETDERRVRASPQLDNLYHADIVLPPDGDQEQHALELMRQSVWRRRSDSNTS